MEPLTDLLPAEAFAASTDGWVAAGSGTRPELVVRPGSTEEVASVMSWASREGVGVLGVGSGRWADPVLSSDPYVVLTTARLTGIKSYEPADLTFTAGAGTLLSTVDDKLLEHGQWTPFDPPHAPERSVGGLVATGDSGPLWMGYGELRNHVLGMTVVTGDGRVLELGGSVVKNVAGYDVVKPMVGSLGSLGIVTAACVRAFPCPTVDRVLVLRGESLAQLVGHSCAIGTAPVLPASSVLVDRMDALGGGAALVVRLHGAGPTVDADQATLEAHLGCELEVVSSPDQVRVTARDHCADAPAVFIASALPSRLGEVLSVLDPLDPSGLAIDTYSGRVRVGAPNADVDVVRSARDSIEQLGGALRVERIPGVGSWDDLSSEASTDELDLTARLQDVFDPSGVLWPARRMSR